MNEDEWYMGLTALALSAALLAWGVFARSVDADACLFPASPECIDAVYRAVLADVEAP